MSRTRDVEDCIEYRRLGAIVRRTIRTSAATYWRKYCETLTSATKLGSVWNMARRINGSQCNPAEVALQDNGVPLDGDLAKANVFARRFAEVSATSNYTAEQNRTSRQTTDTYSKTTHRKRIFRESSI